MGVDYSTNILLPNYNYWSRPIIVTPLASQPGAAAYDARGIYDSDRVDYYGLDGQNFSDQRTTLDIREAEFPVPPRQGDLISIPDDPSGPSPGEFEVTDTNSNGGGESTLELRKWESPAPLIYVGGGDGVAAGNGEMDFSLAGGDNTGLLAALEDI
jgi:hypothetical protein